MIHEPGVIAASWDSVPAQELCDRAAAVLGKHYPGHPWAIHANCAGGVLDIFHPRLSMEWGYRLHLKDVQFDWVVFERSLMRAGGELLESYGVARNRYKHEKIKDIPVDFKWNRMRVDGVEDVNERKRKVIS